MRTFGTGMHSSRPVSFWRWLLDGRKPGSERPVFLAPLPTLGCTGSTAKAPQQKMLGPDISLDLYRLVQANFQRPRPTGEEALALRGRLLSARDRYERARREMRDATFELERACAAAGECFPSIFSRPA